MDTPVFQRTEFDQLALHSDTALGSDLLSIATVSGRSYVSKHTSDKYVFTTGLLSASLKI